MLRFDPPLTVRLNPGDVLAWHQAPARLRVIAGRVWITRRGDPVDHFLQLGDSFELSAAHGTVLSAEQEVWLRFERTPGWAGGEVAARALRRLARRLTGRATPAATVAG